MKNIMTFRYLSIAIFSLALITLTACGDDDDTGGRSTTKQENINKNGTQKGAEMTRIEVPRLAEGRKLVLVKKTSQYGVNFIIEWDCDLKAQRWTAWAWTKQNSVKNWERKKWEGVTWEGVRSTSVGPFRPDPEIPSQYRTELSDYTGSGYQRGHICASEDRICNQEVNGQTFYLSNIHPQLGGHNTGIWQKFEERFQKYRDAEMKASSTSDTIWVVKGATISNVFLNGKEQTGINGTLGRGIPIPKYFYMAFVHKKGATYKGIAIWTEHTSTAKSTRLSDYVISIDELETRTGIDFFCNLPDNIENTVEKLNSHTSWNLQ